LWLKRPSKYRNRYFDISLIKITKKLLQDVFNYSEKLHRRLQDIDSVADEMVKKVQNMKKEMKTRKEVLKQNFFEKSIF
jgi:recombinational DNA repair ATPase RecF